MFALNIYFIYFLPCLVKFLKNKDKGAVIGRM